MSNQRIREDGLRSNFFMVPNKLDDLDLDPYEMRLYIHLKRVTGENGECWQSVRTMAAKCKMGKDTICRAKKSLQDKGLILVEKGDRHEEESDSITIVNIWDDTLYAQNGLPCTLRTDYPVRSERTQEYPIKNTSNTEQPSSPPLSTTKNITDAYQGVVPYPVDWSAGEGRAAKWLAKAGYSGQQVADCYRHLKAQPFWRDKPLSLASLKKQIGEYVKLHPSAATAADGVDYNKFGYTPSGKLVELK